MGLPPDFDWQKYFAERGAAATKKAVERFTVMEERLRAMNAIEASDDASDVHEIVTGAMLLALTAQCDGFTEAEATEAAVQIVTRVSHPDAELLAAMRKAQEKPE